MADPERALEVEVAEIIRVSLVETPIDERWRIIMDTLGLFSKQRSVSKAYVSLCAVHDEKTASLFMYPSGVCRCYGCQFRGDAPDLIVAQHHIPVDEFIDSAGIQVVSNLPRELGNLQRQERTSHTELMWLDRAVGEEPF